MTASHLDISDMRVFMLVLVVALLTLGAYAPHRPHQQTVEINRRVHTLRWMAPEIVQEIFGILP